MYAALDWKFRFLTQEVLNFLGLKLGITKKSVLLNLIICSAVSRSYNIWTDTDAGIFMKGFGVFGVMLTVIIGAALRQVSTDKVGAEHCWNFGLVFRIINNIVLPFPILGLILGFDLGSLLHAADQLSYWAMFYVAACIEPPAKEIKKKSKKLAVAH